MPCLHFSVTGFVCILADTEMRQTFSKLKPVTKLNRKRPTEAAMKEKLHSRKTLKKSHTSAQKTDQMKAAEAQKLSPVSALDSCYHSAHFIFIFISCKWSVSLTLTC